MKIAMNTPKSEDGPGKISAFYPSVRRLPTGGTHRGFVCDASTSLSAQIKLYGMASEKVANPERILDEIFTLEFL